MTARSRIVLAGYLVRCPLGGYAWQAAHYLLGLRALKYDVWFYEDTGHYSHAYDPRTDDLSVCYDYGLASAETFFSRLGLADRWVFVDTWNGAEYGSCAGQSTALLRDADLLINLGGVNHVLPEQRGGRPSVYIDIDPGYTQLQCASGDPLLQAILQEHAHLFTFGENIGTLRSPIPTCGYTWHPTRQPIAIEYWANAEQPCHPYTTIGKWDAHGRDVTYQGQTFQWRKRTEWLRYLDLPKRTGAKFEMAMDVHRVPGDVELLTAHGWQVVDPYAVSVDPWVYRDYICHSRGEFTVAKDMNIRMRSGWFSDRAACYLAAGRPVVEQDTGFGDVIPVGPGLHAFRTVEEAEEAILMIEADYHRASTHAAEVAREYFAADYVLAQLLRVAGLE